MSTHLEGDRIVLRAGTETRTGTLTAAEEHDCVRFVDDTTGRALLADLSHWDAVELDTTWPAHRSADRSRWLRDAIAADPEVLGLGRLRHGPRRTADPRLLLLDDPAAGTRYLVYAHPGIADMDGLSKAVAAARTEQDLNPHVIVVPVVVAEHFPQGVLPARGLALEATARDTGHGLHLVLELIGDGASCPVGGAA